MSRSGTAREALIAELLGDFAELLDRAESVSGMMDVSRKGLVDATRALGACSEPFKAHTLETAAHAQKGAVDHIRQHAALIAGQTVQAQTQAMSEAARAVIEREIRPHLSQLVATLHDLVHRTHRGRWETWATYAATAAVSAVFSALLMGAVIQS